MEVEPLLQKIAHYVYHFNSPSKAALNAARLCLSDSLGCAILALQFQECRQLLIPWVPGTIVPKGCRIPGLNLTTDPVLGAFLFGTMIRWLDYNDTFLANEWAHPSDTIGALLPLMDYLSQSRPLTVRDLLIACIKTYEIQGGLALENSFNRVGIDHVILVKAAVAAVSTHLLGGTEKQIYNVLSQSFIDLAPLRVYRQAPNTGLRKSWAAGDAASRGVALSFLTMRGEKGYDTPLSAPTFGLESVLFKGEPLKLSLTLNSYIIENILFKVSFPAEFHAQTAVEAAIFLSTQLSNIEDIASIDIMTHAAALRIIDKKGPLLNHADRDHCMQYMVAISLIYGTLNAAHYTDEIAKDPRIDLLRAKMQITENPTFTEDYFNPEIRSIASSLSIHLKNGKTLGPCTIEFPLGHKRRREESTIPLFKKLENNLSTHFSTDKVQQLVSIFQEEKELESLTISAFVNLFLN